MFSTNETQPNINKGKGMGLLVKQNPHNQRARPLVDVERFTKVVRRRSQNKARENTIKKGPSTLNKRGLKNGNVNLLKEEKPHKR